MLTLKEQDYQYLDQIHQSLHIGDWETATQKASKMLEDFLHRIYQYLASSVPPEKFAAQLQRGREILEKRGTEFSPAKMTLGELITLFRESNLFTFYGEKTNCNVKELQSINWNKIRDLRNSVSHGGKEKIKPVDAYFVVDTLHSLLRTVTDWNPDKPKNRISKLLGSKIQHVVAFVIPLIALIPLMLYLINLPTISKSNNMLAGHGQEVAELLEKRGAYDLALWALAGDPTVIGRDVIHYRLLKLQAQKVQNYDPVQAYLLYEQAISIPVRGDQDRLTQIQTDLLDKMRPYDKVLVNIKTLPAESIPIIVLSSIGVMVIIMRATRRKTS